MLIVIARFIVGSDAIAQTRPASLTSAEVRERLEDLNRRVGSWYVEYEVPQDNVAAGVYVHRIVAAQKPDRFLHWGSHGTKAWPWQLDPEQQRLIVEGHIATTQHPFNRQFAATEWAHGSPLPGTASQELLLGILGWWNLDMPEPTWDRGIPAPFTLLGRYPNYSLNARDEMVRGAWCNVCEYAGHDRIWIDFARGGVLAARESYSSRNGALLQRIEVTERREIIDGVWIPIGVRVRRYQEDENARGELSRALTIDASIKVLDARLNGNVSASQFHFVPTPGSIRQFADGHVAQVVPGGSEHLDFLADRAKSTFSPITAGKQHNGIAIDVIEASLEYIVMSGCAIFFASQFRNCNRRCAKWLRRQIPEEGNAIHC